MDELNYISCTCKRFKWDLYEENIKTLEDKWDNNNKNLLNVEKTSGNKKNSLESIFNKKSFWFCLYYLKNWFI